MGTQEVPQLERLPDWFPTLHFFAQLAQRVPRLAHDPRFCINREASVTSLTSKRYLLRFPALETLMLDDNKLSNPSCFASLAGLRR